MAWQIADRVKETTTSTGTGALTLAGAIAGYNPFSSIMGNGDTCFYALSAVNAGGVATGAFEIGIGTYATSGNTLTRTTILASSNAGAAVSLAAGTTQVWMDVPASYFKGPIFSAYQSSAQTLASATITKLSLQSKAFDPTSAFDNVTNYRFQPLLAGYYQVTGAFFNAGTACEMVAYVYKNGAVSQRGADSGASAFGATVNALVFLNGSTDYIELYGFMGTGQALLTGPSLTFFQAALVRGAY